MKTVLIFSTFFVVSVLVEAIGVKTGKIFGIYSYSDSLGLSIGGVPLLIGINWVFLVYASNAILTRYTRNSILTILGASLLMVFYDFFMEKAAPLMSMWQFENNIPPFRNYLAWFIMGLIFQTILAGSKVEIKNISASALFFIQIIFFISILAISIVI